MTDETSYASVVADLGYMVTELAARHRNVDAAKREVGKIEAEINAQFGPRLALARARLTAAKIEAGEQDGQTRRDGLEEWERDPEHKRPHPAIGIRVNKVVMMDQDKALVYAIARQKWLNLDLVKFKKDAKLELAKSDPDKELAAFAKIVEQPTATIAKDLTQYLESNDA
jgi:hypothetical protein